MLKGFTFKQSNYDDKLQPKSETFWYLLGPFKFFTRFTVQDSVTSRLQKKERRRRRKNV